jgi:hypothetical protein
VTRSGDHGREMSLTWLLDDETSEAILRGDEVDPHLERLALFANQVRGLDLAPAPPASPALQELIASGGGRLCDATARSRTAAGQGMPPTRRVVRLGFAAKLGLGTAAAALGMAGAAAAGVLPDQANNALRHAVEAFTPVEFPEPTADHPTNFGDRVSRDATGTSDGENGVDGGTISDQAPGAAHSPADPADSGSTGLDRAGETPAAPHVPGVAPTPEADAENGPPDEAPVDSQSPPTTGPDSGGASGNHAPPDAPSGPSDG